MFSSMDTLAIRLLATTSRTFLVPIMRAPGKLRKAIGSAYLCMRAIDEIEDHPDMPANLKNELLTGISERLLKANGELAVDDFDDLLMPHQHTLPEVSMKLGHLLNGTPGEMRSLVERSTGEMAREMAGWVRSGWRITTEQDLDRYTFDVAGRVGLMLSEFWRWYEHIDTPENEAISFGRALQTVNILRNDGEDARRSVNFYPDGWTRSDMMNYARRQLVHADRYMERLPRSSAAYDFCIIPLSLAKSTLAALEQGKEKLSRDDVKKVIESCTA